MEEKSVIFRNFIENGLEDRYFPPTLLKKIILSNNYNYKIIGKSFNGRSIYLLNHGKGKIKVLLWSQMHGNESTATRAMLDLFKFLNSNHPLAKFISENLTIDYIPQLNPDGAYAYTRRNAVGIDLNRDFLQKQSVELPILINQVKENNYFFLFNLHDQRSIFHPKNVKLPATLSFLAPSFDFDRNMSPSREISMKLISNIYQDMKPYLSDGIARFTDEFYPKSTGDNFQKLGFPIMLIECGHYPNDYKRFKTREFTFYAILNALKSLANESWKNQTIKTYQSIPINDNKGMDIIFRNVRFQNESNHSIIDLGVQYSEILENNKVQFIAKIIEVGDLSENFGYVEHNCQKEIIKHFEVPLIDAPADFMIGNRIVKNGKFI